MPHPTVAAYVEAHPDFHEALQLLQQLVLDCGFDEHIKWNMPVYTLGGKNVVGLGAFKNHVALWFFQGALLTDSLGVLDNAQEGKTQAMRHWRFSALADIQKQRKGITTYLLEAKANQAAGKMIKPRKSSGFSTPALLQKAFQANPKLAAAFKQLTPGRQKEYAQYIAEAKREETQLRRIEKISPMIESGMGLNDRYR